MFEDLDSKRVERRCRQVSQLFAGLILDSLGHFAGCFVREGQRKDSVLRYPRCQHVYDAMGDYSRFAGPCSRDDEDGAINCRNCA